MTVHKNLAAGLALLVALVSSSCSINRWAVNRAADLLASGGGGGAFTRDDDPELVAEALPFALKMYESLLDSAPEHTGLLLTTGSGFISYANAFVQSPADMLPDEEYEQREQMLERSRKLYLRGRDYVLKALTIRHPDFAEYLSPGSSRTTGQTSPEALVESPLLQAMTAEDVPYLFWAGAGWLAAIGTDAFNMRLALSRTQAVALLLRALELDESFQDGALHELLVSYYGSVPESAGGSERKAREHYRRALELSAGHSASAHVALATSVAVNRQNVQEFRDLLDKALAVDPDAAPDNRLVTVINQRKARWLLDHVEDYFLLESTEEQESSES